MVLAEKATRTLSIRLGEGVRVHHQDSRWESDRLHLPHCRSAQQGDSALSWGPGVQRAHHSALPYLGGNGYQHRRPGKCEEPAGSPSGGLPCTTCLYFLFLKKLQPEGSGREGGGRGDRDGNTCKSMANSCQCMTKPTTTL